MLLVTQGTMADCLAVAEDISPADELEIQRASGETPAEALRQCFVLSFRCWAVHCLGRPVFVFGLSREDWRWVMPWAFSTPAVLLHVPEFARGSRQVARRLFDEFPNMRNYVDAEHEASVRWLKFMGFALKEPESYGPMGAMFRQFYHVGKELV